MIFGHEKAPMTSTGHRGFFILSNQLGTLINLSVH